MLINDFGKSLLPAGTVGYRLSQLHNVQCPVIRGFISEALPESVHDPADRSANSISDIYACLVSRTRHDRGSNGSQGNRVWHHFLPKHRQRLQCTLPAWPGLSVYLR